MLQGGCKDGNDDRRGMARPWRAHAVARIFFNYYSNKSAHNLPRVQYCVLAVPATGLIGFSREWRRISLHCGVDPDRLVQVPFVDRTSSSGSQDQVGAGEVRSTRRYCTVGSMVGSKGWEKQKADRATL
jgi:hypothetical protein